MPWDRFARLAPKSRGLHHAHTATVSGNSVCPNITVQSVPLPNLVKTAIIRKGSHFRIF
jgi:hypothetical protein